MCGRQLGSIAGMPWVVLLGVVLLATSACAVLPTPIPERAYYPDATGPHTKRLSETLYRAAVAAGDDPARYSFAMIQTSKVAAVPHREASFYSPKGSPPRSRRTWTPSLRTRWPTRCSGTPASG